MKSENQSIVASILTTIAGAWLLLTPLFISMTDAALTNILIVGALIALAGLTQLFYRDNAMPSWFNVVAAVYLFFSAFAFEMSDAATWNMVITAIVTFALAMWDGVEVRHVHDERRTTRPMV